MLVLPWLSRLSLGLPEPLPDPVTKASIRGNAERLGTLLCLWAGLAGVTGPVCSTILTSNQCRQCREEQGWAASTKEASDSGGGRMAIGEDALGRLGPSAVVCTCAHISVCVGGEGVLTVASPRSNWVPSLRGPQKCAFPHLRFYPCCVLAWNLPLPLSAGLSLQGLLEFYSYLWCRRRISPHPSLLQKPGRERERERCGLSPVSCESQVLSPLDSTNEEPCWGLEGGGQGEARASPPFRFPFRGASCSSRVSSVAPVPAG